MGQNIAVSVVLTNRLEVVQLGGVRGSEDSTSSEPFLGGGRGWSRSLVVGWDGSARGFVSMILTHCCCFVKVRYVFWVCEKGMKDLGIDLTDGVESLI